MNRLANKVAIITGSAGGQGRAAALLFAQEGAKVVVADIKAEGARETVTMIKEQGGEALSVVVDLTEPEQVQSMVRATVDNYGRVDVLYNNAARVKFAVLHDMTVEDWNFTLANEVTSVFLCCKYALPYMMQQESGSVINVSSVMAMVTSQHGGRGAHGMAKGAIIGLTKQMAGEYARYGIRCNVICPGSVETPASAITLSDPTRRERQTRRIPLGRLGKPEDIAPLALYLASEESSYVTGAVFVVDGGWTSA